MPLAPKTLGKDFNYFSLITVSSTSFTSESQVTFGFRGQRSFSLVNYGSVTVHYSFNGNTVHGDLRPGTPTAAIAFDERYISGIWLKLATVGSAEVRIEAWA